MVEEPILLFQPHIEEGSDSLAGERDVEEEDEDEEGDIGETVVVSDVREEACC